jgi:hypothetical protein
MDDREKLQRIKEILEDADLDYSSEPQSTIFEDLLDRLYEVVPFKREYN